MTAQVDGFREVTEAEMTAAAVDLAAFEGHLHHCGICDPVVDAGDHPSLLCNRGRMMLRRLGRHEIEVIWLVEAVAECPICQAGISRRK